jgi:hypothetical protein
MPATRWSKTLTGLSSTAGYIIYYPDIYNMRAAFNLSVAAVRGPTSSSTAIYNLEGSQDYTGSSTFVSTAATWFSSIVSQATSVDTLVQVTVPISALRVNVTAGTSLSTITLTVISAG